MKKGVMLMVGILAVALAGSAQAANTMFSVQDASAVDKMVVQDNGYIGIGISAPLAPFHVVVSGNTPASASFNYSFTNTGTLSGYKAPNITLYRNNDPAAAGTLNPNDGTLPRADDTLGALQFGSIVSGGGRVLASIAAKAEVTPTLTVQPTYIAFTTAYNNAGAFASSEKVRITSVGDVGIGTTAPTSKLQVVDLPVFANNAAAAAAGLTAGAFYRTAAGVLMVVY